MMLTPIHTPRHWNDVVHLSRNTPIIVDVYATYCRPCKLLMPKMESLAKAYPSAEFYKMNIEEMKDTVMGLGIKKVPTILFLRDGEELLDMRITGGNIAEIEKRVIRHIQ